MAKISAFKNTNPYPDADFVEVESILGKPIKVKGVEYFENEKGPGIHILADMDGDEIRICSHGVALVDQFNRTEIYDCLKDDVIEGKFIKITSSKNKDRKVLKFVDPEDSA